MPLLEILRTRARTPVFDFQPNFERCMYRVKPDGKVSERGYTDEVKIITATDIMLLNAQKS